MKLVLATFNRDKVRELQRLLAGRTLGGKPVEVVGLYDMSGAKVPPETGKSVAENALIKARAAYDHTGLTSIADDTALEVDALGGKPGIYAARFAGPGASYSDNVRHLIEVLEGVEVARRTARFRTACVACLTDGRELISEGVLEGRILAGLRGENGFGYDPVFEIPGMSRTLAELSATEKNEISHRARAMRDLMKKMEFDAPAPGGTTANRS